MSLTRRSRMVPPTIFEDEILMLLPAEVRLTAIGLRFYVDDEGRGSATPRLLAASLWPMHDLGDDVIEEHLVMLEDAGYLTLYVADDGRTLLQLNDWPKVDRATPSRLPAPGKTAGRTAREQLANTAREHSSRAQLASSGEREREEEERERGEERGEVSEEDGAGEEPPLGCKKHPNGSDYPCGPCGTARSRHERWHRAKIRAAADEDEESGG